MSEDSSFVLVDLKDDKSKKLAQAITRETARKILAFLAERKDSTETEIATAMNQPISTIHYNLQQLTKSGFVEVQEFHYSKKGKEINHYALSNKIIIIAPRKTESFAKKLRKILPIGIIAAGTAGIIMLIQNALNKSAVLTSKIAETASYESARAANTATNTAVNTAADTLVQSKAMAGAGTETIVTTGSQSVFQNTSSQIALWFLIGAIFTLLAMIIYEKIKEK